MKTTQTDLRWHLRVTVLPQCNFRCRYCNPKGIHEHAKTFDDEEILDIVEAAVACGIVRVHWTGGEPCLRDMVKIMRGAKNRGMVEQVMTSNGSLRFNEIEAMKEAGLTRVNISLDSLNRTRNETITGAKAFDTTLKWIVKSCQTFNTITKMNIVPMTDNLDEIPAMIEFAQSLDGKLWLKFIELCPNNPAFYGDEIQQYFAGREKLIQKLSTVGDLTLTTGVGDNPNAEYYLVGDTGVKIILITMPTYNFKCGLGKCHKMRISPFGMVGSCIQQKGDNLMGLTFAEKVAVLRKKMELRHSYSDTPPVERQHLRKDYGIWRFGNVSEVSQECARC